MAKFAVIKTGGKQYLVKEQDVVTVDNLNVEKNQKVNFDALAVFSDEGKEVDLGSPLVKEKVEGEVVDSFKGDKIRVAKFKAKVRYRKVRGFRPSLTKVKITKV